MRAFKIVAIVVGVLTVAIVSLSASARYFSKQQSGTSENYYIFIDEKQIDLEKWTLKENETIFYYGATPTGKLSVAKKEGRFTGFLSSNRRKFRFEFPQSPEYMKAGQEIEGSVTISEVDGDEASNEVSQSAKLIKKKRTGDGRIVLVLFSGTETNLITYCAMWLYEEEKGTYLLPDQMLQIIHWKYGGITSTSEALSQIRKFKPLSLPAEITRLTQAPHV